jgi:hypothetical protein
VAGCFRDLLKTENVKVDFIEYIYVLMDIYVHMYKNMYVSEIRDVVCMAGFIVLQHLVQLCRFSIESMTSCQAGILEQQHMTTITTQKKTLPTMIFD